MGAYEHLSTPPVLGLCRRPSVKFFSASPRAPGCFVTPGAKLVLAVLEPPCFRFRLFGALGVEGRTNTLSKGGTLGGSNFMKGLVLFSGFVLSLDGVR